MTFTEWMETVPQEFKGDPLWRMEVYRLSVFAADLAWPDVTKLIQDKRTISLADQLFRAVGSASANIAEGYGCQSGKDQARYYEYALGSAREARNWYYQSRHVLTEPVALHRIRLLTQIIRLLLTIIPSERGYKLQEDPVKYEWDDEVLPVDLLTNVPMPL
ncbi:MAG: four helix bundle protein [Verrucomicrobia bacterium]|nr:four helix bundle protein [Verrucomicrobiota bacterium]